METFEISKNELDALKIYKTKSVGDIGYENINLFMNFLNNPSDELLTNIKLNIDSIDNIIDAMKSFIDLSCKYALNNGEIGERLYRYEDERNLDSYKNGFITSLKSTSNKPRTVKYTFGHEKTVSLVFKPTKTFCPYIKVDDIINNSALFANESEFLLPPYVNCELTDEYEKDNFQNDSYRVIHIKDNFSDPNVEKLDILYRKYCIYRESYTQLFKYDKKQGKVSEELKKDTEVINNYLKEYARCQYFKYNELYKKKYNIEEKNINFDNLNIDQGIHDAINKYYANQDPNKSWIETKDYGVYTLQYLIEHDSIPNHILNSVYNNQDLSILEKYLKEENTNSRFSSFSDETYQEFLKLFNIASGYNDEKSTREERINAANSLSCGEFIQNHQR